MEHPGKTPQHRFVRQGTKKRRVCGKQLPQPLLSRDGCFAVRVPRRAGTAQGQRALNEPVYVMVQGQLMEQLQVLHSGPRTCTHPSFALEKQEAPDEPLCLPLSNFYHRIVTPCVAVCTLCGQHRVVVAASESRQPHDMQPSGDVHISAAYHIYYEACACGETDSYVLACGEENPQDNEL